MLAPVDIILFLITGFVAGAFGGLLGLGAGAVIGAAGDSDHVGRDAAIGLAAGVLLGVVIGVYDAQSGPQISVHSDTVFGRSLGLDGHF